MLAELKLQFVIGVLEDLSNNGMPRARVAESIGIKPQQLSNAISARKSVSDELFDKIASVAGINHIDLSIADDTHAMSFNNITQRGKNNIVGQGHISEASSQNVELEKLRTENDILRQQLEWAKKLIEEHF